MKRNRWALAVLLASVFINLHGQKTASNSYQNFPIIVSMQFHAFSMPFKDLKTNFKNVGIGLGTEWSLNRSNSLIQQINLQWIRNRQIGNRFMVNTQSVWRPSLGQNFYGEARIGLGYMISRLPSDGLIFEESRWTQVNQSKGLFHIPIGLGFGYQVNSTWATFINYQTLFVSKYNPDVPIVPETILQFGSRVNIH